jgi:glycosyltransferase involved in cell wall biosynthesis
MGHFLLFSLWGTGDVDGCRFCSKYKASCILILGKMTLYFTYTPDCLALPSGDEPWGLVVNEALCFSTHVVVSSNVGCHYDQVVDGTNGIVVSDLNPVNLVGALNSALQMSKLQMFEVSIDIFSVWNLTNSAKNIVTMLTDMSII